MRSVDQGRKGLTYWCEMNDSGLSRAQYYISECPGLAIYVDAKNNSTLQKRGTQVSEILAGLESRS